MAKQKSRNIQRISNKKRGRPKVKFSIWILILLFVFAFAAFFVAYMVSANMNEDFLENEFGSITDEEVQSVEEPEDTEEPDDEPEEPTAEKIKITNPIPQSTPSDSSYFDSCCLITDSTLLQMADFTNLKDIIGNEDLNALNCNSTKVATNYGTVTAYETIQIKRPDNVYIMLGSDIGTDPVDEMIDNYSKLVENLLSAVIALGATGIFAAAEFLILQAPDVAISEAAVGAALSPLIFIVTLKKIKGGKDK